MEDLRKVVADLKELGDKVDITYITYVAFCSLLSKKMLYQCIYTNLIIADFEVTS